MCNNKINILQNKHAFHIHIMNYKNFKKEIIKNKSSLSNFFKIYIYIYIYYFLRKYSYMSKIFLRMKLKFYFNITTHYQTYE